MAGNYNEIATVDEIEEGSNVIAIQKNRQLVPGNNFDTVIAYEGDINSQVVIFKCVESYDGVNLSQCDFKELKWKNLTSGIEGISSLSLYTAGEEETEAGMFYLKWLVPAALCAQSGEIEISISIYNKTQIGENEEFISFSWNTAKYSGLSIGESTESIGIGFPPKDEILIINKDTKDISAPTGYNNVFCNYGDVGLSEIYFVISRYIGKNNKIDITSSDTKITISCIINGLSIQNTTKDDKVNITKTLYTATTPEGETVEEGVVLITWKVPSEVTAGEGGPNGLQIMLGFEDTKTKTNWLTNTYSELRVGPSLFDGDFVEPSDWNSFSSFIQKSIITCLEDNSFIINAEKME